MSAQPGWPLVATCSRGLEEVLEAEIRDLGGRDVARRRGAIQFRGNARSLARVCIGARSAMRVLSPLTAGDVADRGGLYELARTVEWERFLRPGGTVWVEVAGRHPTLTNTRFAAQVVKDAVVDRLRDRTGSRPSVDRENPDLPIHVHLGTDSVSLALDAAGSPLSRRGYRPRSGPAPLNEALAAGLLLMAGYDGTMSLVDPFCGTGTLVIEAALIANRLAPNLRRRFAFERFPGHDPKILETVREEFRAQSTRAEAPIEGRDSEPAAITATLANARRAGVIQTVRAVQEEATAMTLPETPGIIVGNPPWGQRMGEGTNLDILYGSFGDRLKAVAEGWIAWLLVGESSLAKKVGLRASRRIPVFNGPVECRWLRYDLYAGSKKHPNPDAEA
jgi:putative N6-adenine-specific DNA methylase